jgi:hypothetical protein
LRPSKARSAKAHTPAWRWQIDQSALGQPQCYSTAHRLGCSRCASSTSRRPAGPVPLATPAVARAPPR